MYTYQSHELLLGGGRRRGLERRRRLSLPRDIADRSCLPIIVKTPGSVIGRVEANVLDGGRVAAAALFARAGQAAALALAVGEALRVVVQPMEAAGIVGLLELDNRPLDALHRAARLDPAVDGVAGRVDKLDIARVRPRGRVGGL